ncbi:hypothetical protein UA08_01615 [Talaromyces atroroseus]|uniref:Uncharacterized protein n=1 Tax=Talaromyces atroroseus TaxID=1441469 RepID=A0A1Q5QBG0_TALAT|nr:hypothetical protein UA08_01615 [Talaromyces atroroseus]OKL63221.1 hypothetical protein UA08_01615 [Talaromyces atroroseus]
MGYKRRQLSLLVFYFCDRKTPCQHCISRGVQDRSSYQETKPKSQSQNRGGYSDSVSFDAEDSSELGYMKHGPGALQEIERTNVVSQSRKKQVDITQQSQRSIREMLPKKPIIDNLIDIFFKEVNRVYEMLYEPTFVRDYKLWWQGIVLADTVKEAHEIGLHLELCRNLASATSTKNYGDGHFGSFMFGIGEKDPLES